MFTTPVSPLEMGMWLTVLKSPHDMGAKSPMAHFNA
jgi:hypothetical protein